MLLRLLLARVRREADLLAPGSQQDQIQKPDLANCAEIGFLWVFLRKCYVTRIFAGSTPLYASTLTR